MIRLGLEMDMGVYRITQHHGEDPLECGGNAIFSYQTHIDPYRIPSGNST